MSAIKLVYIFTDLIKSIKWGGFLEKNVFEDTYISTSQLWKVVSPSLNYTSYDLSQRPGNESL